MMRLSGIITLAVGMWLIYQQVQVRLSRRFDSY